MVTVTSGQLTTIEAVEELLAKTEAGSLVARTVAVLSSSPQSAPSVAPVRWIVRVAAGASTQDGWRRLRLTFPAAAAARVALLQFGELVEVLEPPELRREMAEHAQALVELYSEGSPPAGSA